MRLMYSLWLLACCFAGSLEHLIYVDVEFTDGFLVRSLSLVEILSENAKPAREQRFSARPSLRSAVVQIFRKMAAP